MKKTLIILSLFISSFALADENISDVDLDQQTQFAVINALLASDTAQNTFFGENSASEALSRDISTMFTSEFESDTKLKISFSCSKSSNDDYKMNCRLSSHWESTVDGETYESAMWVSGDVFIYELSTQIEVSNVQVDSAG